MKTRNFKCEGDVCNPQYLLFKKGTVPCDSYLNYCTAEYDERDRVWIVPKGWAVINGKVICPRCLDEK